MKKLIISLLSLFFILLITTSCKSTKKGCGLTSDAHQTNTNPALVHQKQIVKP